MGSSLSPTSVFAEFKMGNAQARHIVNLFDMDGNKIITLNELYEMMAVFIEIGEGKDHKIDLAKMMAEMFKKGDENKDDVLELSEFKKGMVEHPITGKILRRKNWML